MLAAVQENPEETLDGVWQKMRSRATAMLAVFKGKRSLPLALLICNPRYEPQDDDLDLEYDEFQSRYSTLKLLVSLLDCHAWPALLDLMLRERLTVNQWLL